MEGIVQGIVSRQKDDGKISTIIHLTGIEFDDYSQEAQIHEGKGVEQIYCSKMVDCHPGDRVDVVYRPGYQGKAMVDRVVVLDKKK